MTQNNEPLGDLEDSQAESWKSAHEMAGLDGLRSAEAMPPSRSEQAEELLHRQLEQQDSLQQVGILETAAGVAGIDPNNPMVKPSVRVVQELQHNGDVIQLTEVAFAVTEITSTGDEQRRIRHAAVAATFGGVTMPREDFTQEQADAIVAIADDLRKAKHDGVLPNIGPDLSEIV